MKSLPHKNKLLYFIIVFLLSLSVCFLFLANAKKSIDNWASYDPLQRPISHTEKLLEYVKTYPLEVTPPPDVPADLRNEVCWTLLRTTIKSSNPDYTITSFQNGNGKNPDPRVLEDVIVEIRFSNSQTIQLHYYQGWLIDCSGDKL